MNAPAINSPAKSRLTTWDEDVFGRRMSSLVAFCVSPIIMWLLLSAITSLQSVGATGLPLGSPGGQLSILLATIGMLIISQTARWSAMGLFILTGWAAAFTVYVAASMGSAQLPQIFDDQALLQWSYFPVLIFTICLAASLATRRARLQRLRAARTCAAAPQNSQMDAENPAQADHADAAQNYQANQTDTLQERDTDPDLAAQDTPPLTPNPRLAPPRWAWPTTLLASGLALLAGALVFSLAPRTSVPLIMQHPSWYLKLEAAPTIAVIVLIATLFALTWLAHLRPMPVQIAAWVLMLLPGLVVIPLFTTVIGWMPTPDDGFAISLAMSMPVTGTLGATIAATTQALFALSKPEDIAARL